MAALNVNGMLWRTSPAATELEQVVTDWLRQLLGLTPGWFGMVNDLASTSTLYALAAALLLLASLGDRLLRRMRRATAIAGSSCCGSPRVSRRRVTPTRA